MCRSTWIVLAATTLLPALGACTDRGGPDRIASVPGPSPSMASANGLDAALRAYLDRHGFTGRVASTLEARLGRRVDQQVAEVGRMLWFDPIGGLNDDNTCAGCHSPTNGFGDTQSIAIGIENNGIVGPGRTGPRNQRRTPMVINTAFYPDADVELALRAALGRPVRQPRAGSSSRARGPNAVVPAAPARGAGVHSAHRARRGGGVRVPGGQRCHPRPRCCAA